MSIRRLQCQTMITLLDAEHDFLRQLERPAHKLERQYWCEMPGGHEGPHCSLAQDSDDSWWLRWYDAARRELLALEYCDYVDKTNTTDDLDGATCMLPKGHLGEHSCY